MSTKINSRKMLKLDRALDAMRTGVRLIEMHGRDGTHWYLLPGGEVDATTAEAIKGHINVRGTEDGLFPGHSQVWRMLSFI
jgi:hypothetical protein